MYSSTHEQNVSYISMKYYSPLKGKEILTDATMFILNKISLSQEDTVVPLI